MTTYQTVYREIVANNYYVNLLTHLCNKRDVKLNMELGTTEASLANNTLSNERAHTLLSDFWYALPDVPSIRTDPFYTLCDYLEQ